MSYAIKKTILGKLKLFTLVEQSGIRLNYFDGDLALLQNNLNK